MIVDNETRWLSQLFMIKRAIQLKIYLKILFIVAREDWDKEHRSKKTRVVSRRQLEQLPRYLRPENQLSDRD
jgi:hypothetical protein